MAASNSSSSDPGRTFSVQHFEQLRAGDVTEEAVPERSGGENSRRWKWRRRRPGSFDELRPCGERLRFRGIDPGLASAEIQ